MTCKSFVLAIFILVAINIDCFCQSEFGVWANKDCELLKTRNSSLFFERIGHDYQIKFIQFEIVNNKIICKSFGEIHFRDTVKTFEYLKYHTDSVISNEDIGFFNNNHISIKGKSGLQQLDLVENITMISPYEMNFCDSSKIGTCLQEWMMGTSLELNEKEGLFRFKAGTNQHSFMFDIQKGFTYCRAARIKSSNHGTYMAQNIRLYDDGKYKAAIMKENNLIESSQPLIINNDLFNPNACSYVPNGFYWSLIEFKKDMIVLNGCQNRYEFGRPTKYSEGLKEWIKFVKY